MTLIRRLGHGDEHPVVPLAILDDLDEGAVLHGAADGAVRGELTFSQDLVVVYVVLVLLQEPTNQVADGGLSSLLQHVPDELSA